MGSRLDSEQVWPVALARSMVAAWAAATAGQVVGDAAWQASGGRGGGDKAGNQSLAGWVVCQLPLSVMGYVFQKGANRAADRKPCAFNAA